MPPDRLYTVTELARELGVTARAVRFYEDKGLIAPHRVGTTRVFTPRDRARMILILRGKRLGFRLSEIAEYLDLYDTDATHRAQLKMLLEKVCDRLTRLEQQRIALDEAVAELSDIKAQTEAALRGQETRGRRAAQ
jgi:DNA-binding transcriptional MerR regulator